MKKKHSISIIIFSTVVSVFTMVYINSYVNNLKFYEENKLHWQAVVEYNKAHIQKVAITNDNQGKAGKQDDEVNSNFKDYLDEDDLSNKNLSDVTKNEDIKNIYNSNGNSINENMQKTNESKDIRNDMYLPKTADNIENYNYYIKEKEQSVFKVSTSKIEENLTISDKIKFLYVSMQLGNENYKKVEEYLYAEDAEDGVLKALKLLKEELSKKEYEKVRKIAGKFIDMDAAEKLY